MADIKSYLDKDGLQKLIELIPQKFKTKNAARLDAGLKLKTISDKESYNIEQNTYYLYEEEISNFNLGSYVCGEENKNIMGEVVLQFTPNSNLLSISDIKISNANILWKNGGDNINLSKGKIYQVRLTTDNIEYNGKYTMLADLSNYSRWQLPGSGPDEGGSDTTSPEKMDNCIEITYESKEENTIQIFNETWLNAIATESSIAGIYYCENYKSEIEDTKQIFNILTLDNIRNTPKRKITGNSKVIVKFVYDVKINLKNLLNGINFNTIKFTDLNGYLITDMTNMLSGGSVAASLIDFTGIKYPENGNNNVLYGSKCINLLSNRLTYNPNDIALKLYIGDEDAGIKFSELTSMKGIFDGCIRESTGTEDKITELISRIKTSKCNDFTYMFRNCYLANANFNGYKMNLSDEMIYTGMFRGAKFKDVDQLKTLKDFIVPKDSRGSNDENTAVYYSEMFMGTNLSDYSSLFWDDSSNVCKLSYRQFGSYSFKSMFAGCNNLYKIPVINLKKNKVSIFDEMFKDACKNISRPDFSNLSKWSVLAGTMTNYDGIQPTLSFKSMFENCNLSQLNTKLNFFISSVDSSEYTTFNVYDNYLNLTNMFKGSGIKEIKLNLYAVVGDGILPEDIEDPTWTYGVFAAMLNSTKTMFDMNNYCSVNVSYDQANTDADKPGNLFRLLYKVYYGTNVEIKPLDY